MQELEKIVKKIKQKTLPTIAEKKKVNSIINFSKKRIEEQIKNLKINAEIFVGGSIAKNTWIKNHHDIDFFVRFNKKHKNIGKILQKIVKNVFKNSKVMHGSRDYCKVKYKNYNLEFVPVYEIKNPSEAENSMDASLFHVEYVRGKIKENPKLADEIRVFKTFAKAQGVYGAETHIAGLSGYVSELLMIYYKKFSNLVKESENLKPKIYIDIEKYYKNKQEINRKLKDSKLMSPIIIIDPMLKKRNAAAALDNETFSNLIFSLRMFSRKPTLKFFNEKKMKISDIKKQSKKRGTLLAVETIKKEYLKEDVFLAKLKRVLKKVSNSLERKGIAVYNSGYFVEKNNLKIFYELETKKLSKYKKHFGPPVWIKKENFNSFIKKHKNVYVSEGCLVCDSKREFEDIKKFTLSILKKELSGIL